MLPSFQTPDLSQLSFNTEVTTDPNVTVANIEKYYPELQSTWDIGEQTATLTGETVSRTFSELTFENHAQSMEIVNLDYYSEEYQGSSYYRVLHQFYENEYYSSISEEHDNFTKWESCRNIYLQEVIYKHALLNTLEWNRPYTVVLCNEGACSPLPIIEPTQNNTGIGAPRNLSINNPPIPALIQWNSLNIPYKRTIFVGKALGATIECDSNYIARLKSSESGTGINISSTGIILLTKPYLEIEILEATQYLPTYLKINFYGKELWRSFSPIVIDEEPDILVHNPGTTQSDKYKPPGRSTFPDRFWNSNPNSNPYEGYIVRQEAIPSWL